MKKALLGATAFLVLGFPGDLVAEPTIRVGPTVQVSREGAEREHEEVILAAHPTDPKRLLGCSFVDRTRYKERLMHGVAYTSEDGGLHWKHAVESTQFDGDPMCGYGPDGRAYFLSIGVDDENWKKVNWWIEIFRSEDGGRTWEKGVVGRGGDRPYLAFDASDGPTRGLGYIVYSIRATALDRKGKFAVPRDATVPTLEVLRSDDGWKTWSKAAVGVILGPSFCTPSGAAVLSDGSVATLWLNRFEKKDKSGKVIGEGPREEISVSVAGPRAELFGPSVKIANYVADRPDSGTFFSLASDATRGPFRDRLYAAWTDTRTPRSQILVSFSSDAGKTWSKPRAVNDFPADAPKRLDDFMPTVAVNRDGVVGVTWKRRTKGDEDADVRFTASLDGGKSWLPSALVASAAGEVAEGVLRAHLRPEDDAKSAASRRAQYFKGGDTSGLAGDAAGVFHALWADQRSGIGQIFTAAIEVGRAER